MTVVNSLEYELPYFGTLFRQEEIVRIALEDLQNLRAEMWEV